MHVAFFLLCAPVSTNAACISGIYSLQYYFLSIVTCMGNSSIARVIPMQLSYIRAL